MQDFRNLDVWRKAHLLVLAVHKATLKIPKEEVFGITLQLRRASMLIPMRIAEGCGKDGAAEFIADLRRAAAGTSDLEYLVLLAGDLGYLDAEVATALQAGVVEVRKMVYGLLRSQ